MAQVPVAELEALFPPGGCAGETVTVQAHGNNLDELAGVIVSHPAIKPEIEGIRDGGDASPVSRTSR
jgi:hypothetical protein